MNQPNRRFNPVGCLMEVVLVGMVLGALLGRRDSTPQPPKTAKWDQDGSAGANWPMSGAAEEEILSGDQVLSSSPDEVAYGSSIITFDNQSGEPALVRLVGPTRAEVDVPNGTRKSIHSVAPGRYVIRVRYGTPGRYRYTEGEPFEVEASAFSYSHVTISLHMVSNGNYTMRPSSQAAFAAAAP